MKPQEVTDALKLSQLKDKIWFVVPSCATTGEGLLEGLVRSPLSPPVPPFPLSALLPLPRPNLSTLFHKDIILILDSSGLALQQRKIPAQRPRQEIVSDPSSILSTNTTTAQGKTLAKDTKVARDWPARFLSFSFSVR